MLSPTVSNGLVGEYFTYSTLGVYQLALSRIDSNINFNWGLGSPDVNLPTDHFAASWAGKLVAPTTATYTLTTHSDDGIRLWVNGVLLIDHWNDHGVQTDTATVAAD